MKRLISCLLLAAALCCGADAQTPSTNAPGGTNTTNFTGFTQVLQGLGAGQGTLQVAGAVTTFFTDAQPYITNGNCMFEGGLIQNGGHTGGLFDLQVPVSTNSWQVTYGLAFAYLNKHFYDAAATVQLGTQVSLPGISKWLGPVYIYNEAGPGYDLSGHAVVVQDFLGVKYAHSFGTRLSVGASAGYGIISSLPGQCKAFTGFVTYQF